MKKSARCQAVASRGVSLLDILVTISVLAVVVALVMPSLRFSLMGVSGKLLALTLTSIALAVYFWLQTLRLATRDDVRGRFLDGAAIIAGAGIAAVATGHLFWNPRISASASQMLLRASEAVGHEGGLDAALNALSAEQRALWDREIEEAGRRVIGFINWSSMWILASVAAVWGWTARRSPTYRVSLQLLMQSRVYCIISTLGFLTGAAILLAKVLLAEAVATPGAAGDQLAGPWVRVVLSSPILNDATVFASEAGVAAEQNLASWARRVTAVSVFELALIGQFLCYYALDRWGGYQDGGERPATPRRDSLLRGSFATFNVFTLVLLGRKVAYICLYFPGGVRLTI